MLKDFYRLSCIYELESITILHFIYRELLHNSETMAFWSELWKMLTSDDYHNPHKIWQKNLGRFQKQYYINEEQWMILNQLSTGMFGMSKIENQKCLVSCLKQYEQVLQEYQKAYQEKKKVYTPVAYLGTVILIIMLL